MRDVGSWCKWRGSSSCTAVPRLLHIQVDFEQLLVQEGGERASWDEGCGLLVWMER